MGDPGVLDPPPELKKKIIKGTEIYAEISYKHEIL